MPAATGGVGTLTAHEVVPVEYGDGLAECLRHAAPDGIDAFIDPLGPHRELVSPPRYHPAAGVD